MAVPIIQVLSKQNYEDQHIVSLATALPLSRLAPSSLRISTKILSLTTNNLSYARLGHLLGWWDVHPLPSSIPSKYSDPTAYGRLSCWGYGTVLESTLTGPSASKISVGTHVYGYLPIGTLPVDMQVEVNPAVPGQFFEISEARSKIMPIYNRYLFYPPTTTAAADKESLGLDALCQVLFETAYLMNRFVFAWIENELAQPGKDLGPPSTVTWKFEDAKIREDTVVLLFAASGKTGLSFGYELKHGRPAESTPRMVIAVGSESSKGFTQGTGLFDKVLTYDADSDDLAKELGLEANSKVVVCDFGSRGVAAGRWVTKLKQSYEDVLWVGVGGEVVPDSPEKVTEKFMAGMTSSMIQVNASGMRTQAMVALGEKEYFEDFLKHWTGFKMAGGFKGLRLVWGEGMEAVGKGWEKLCKGEVGPDEGLVFDLRDQTESGKL
ncbi:hypothetical protein D0Z07_1038 [Hyphodiscus hymeniophilus]|uniref:Uncharacterized protein n=1 Tax=Hyphodiscus hymeniophilus TaxID=353542 RepID=A0A9P7B0D7_9HELO|nr:hypothetical protein D0Z07_1038 [Hyphodiscus hymeniophilus]